MRYKCNYYNIALHSEVMLVATCNMGCSSVPHSVLGAADCAYY